MSFSNVSQFSICVYIYVPLMLHSGEWCRIIQPLTSRCSKFRFKPLAVDVMRGRLQYIAEKENVTCSDEVQYILNTDSQTQGN